MDIDETPVPAAGVDGAAPGPRKGTPAGEGHGR